MSRAFRSALGALDARDRLRLSYYYVHGLTLAETGRLLREHEASVSRHLTGARRALRKDVDRRLRDAGLTEEQVNRAFEFILEDCGTLDLSSLLADRSDARNHDSFVQARGAASERPGVRKGGRGERG
jgi:hypothetical protein